MHAFECGFVEWRARFRYRRVFAKNAVALLAYGLGQECALTSWRRKRLADRHDLSRPSHASRSFSPGLDPIVNAPAGTTTICGQFSHSRNVSFGFNRRCRARIIHQVPAV
jgi:hypothetical protein